MSNSSIQKDNPKYIKAWTFYDWANSVYPLVINSTIFPLYYGTITKAGTEEEILLNGLKPETAFDFALALSFLLVSLGSPILSSLADTMGNKLKFLKIFCYLGAFSCMGLFFMTSETLYFGLLSCILASIGFWGSMVFYNAYLPEISSDENMDKISAKGFIKGYTGSVILLIICLVLLQGVATEENLEWYTRSTFLMVGIWWIGFAQYTFKNLPPSQKKKENTDTIFVKARKELQLVFSQVQKMKPLKTFLASFFFFSLGMQTIIMMSTLYAKTEVGLGSSELIIMILIIQFEAMLGAWIFQWASHKIGNQRVLLFGISMWMLFTFLVFGLDKNDPNITFQFYAVAALAGFVVGGIQAISRSTYSKLIPITNDPTTFFSFYDVFEKVALFTGLVVYGLVIQNINMKSGMLAMGISFAIAFIMMLRLSNKNFKSY